MWKIIDNNIISDGLRPGQFISANARPVEYFEILQVKENGNIYAVSTTFTGYNIIFPKQDLLDAKWWVLG